MISITLMFFILASVSTTSLLEKDGSTFNSWREAIAARPEELAWQSIPWRTSFRDGIRDANAAGKPMLLWLMNGHPMGCT